ncbi:MAG: T9SS type A sorting domain-containing protein [bacterium]|nr:T9SS type A sorting domain-containing protein [bacterium]
MKWLLALLIISSSCFGGAIEDFESGTITLTSFQDQDQDPNDWQLTTDNPHSGNYSLMLYGNTWKSEAINPVAVTDTTVWQIAIYCETRGEMQGFGISDGVNQLFYTFFGRDLPEDTNWYTVYQGAFSQDQWHQYMLPIGRDWEIAFGYLPTINELVFVNDADASTVGETQFDSIIDVTDNLPQAPHARILYTVEDQQKVSAELYRLSIQFYGEVFDPDSETHTWAWDFGDSTTSTLQNPQHEFLISSDHFYTVGLNVTDPDGLAAGDTCQVAVAEGEPTGPLTVNFVGDVFTGRGYENYGGIIDTYGIEALYTPTLDILGNAADVNVVNLEVPYTDRGAPHPTKSVVFRSEPENIVGIQYAGIDVVTLGNNHIIDYGEIGMLDTFDGLDQLNIKYSGAGSTEYMALLPTFWTEKGVRLGFLGLCNRTGRAWNYQPFLDAGYNKPGFAYLLPDNLDRCISYTKPLSDIVIVQTHSGDEYETAPSRAAEANDSEIRFRNEPTPGEIDLRRHAIDAGADILINHHPHVLQGFESYNGKLIAHSLGNFIFDLYYTETMPTMVLTLEIEKTGITGYRFTPAWINHWIPEPATGNLGREIIGRIADYSLSMNAIVTPIANSNEARIYLNRADTDSSSTATETVLQLVEEDGFAISPPEKLSGRGSLASIETPGSNFEIRYGREMLWHGGFEDEGADLWDDNTEDEVMDEEVFYSGARSLRLRRLSSASGQTGTDLEKHLPCDPEKEHSAVSWLKADNAYQARTMVRFYNGRYATSPVGDYDIAPRLDGSTDWTFQWRNLETPSNATYFDMRCGHEPPDSDTGYSWYDDLALIEWDNWIPAGDKLIIPAPNNYRFVQVRNSDTGLTEVVLNYEETAYGPLDITAVPGDVPTPANISLRCFPNPFNPRVTIELNIANSANEVTVEIFDLRGKKVCTLHQGILPEGLRHGMTWNGQNDNNENLASGVYLVQVKADNKSVGQKITLVR